MQYASNSTQKGINTKKLVKNRQCELITEKLRNEKLINISLILGFSWQFL